MTLMNVAKSKGVEDDESATFGKHSRPNTGFFNLSKVLERPGKGQKCQVRRDCKNVSIGHCDARAYRGCTLAFC